MPPQSVEYQDALDDAALEWIRVRIWIERGQVTRFVVQYETTLANERAAVVRYDTAHGSAHRDRMTRDVKQLKDDLGGTLGTLSLADALETAEGDIRQNWRQYRRGYENQP
jgi:hypothetical protein